MDMGTLCPPRGAYSSSSGCTPARSSSFGVAPPGVPHPAGVNLASPGPLTPSHLPLLLNQILLFPAPFPSSRGFFLTRGPQPHIPAAPKIPPPPYNFPALSSLDKSLCVVIQWGRTVYLTNGASPSGYLSGRKYIKPLPQKLFAKISSR